MSPTPSIEANKPRSCCRCAGSSARSIDALRSAASRVSRESPEAYRSQAAYTGASASSARLGGNQKGELESLYGGVVVSRLRTIDRVSLRSDDGKGG
jgi:hypothetical protein